MHGDALVISIKTARIFYKKEPWNTLVQIKGAMENFAPFRVGP